MNWPPAWVAFLSPVAHLDQSVWFGVRPDIGLPQALYLLGLIGLALGSLALRDRTSPRVGGALLASGILLAAGVTLLVGRTPEGGVQTLMVARNTQPAEYQPGFIPYTPVCGADPLPVCVHPAYEPWLRDNATLLNRLFAPVLGLPGAPTRAEQSATHRYAAVGDVFFFSPTARPEEDRYAAATLARMLVQDFNAYRSQPRPACPGGTPLRCMDAQKAIALWLLKQAGVVSALGDMDSRWVQGYYGANVDAIAAAAERFAALDPVRQREWLQAHYADLRAGRVSLEQLP